MGQKSYTLLELEELVKTGQSKQVRSAFRDLKTNKFKRSEQIRLANIARRSGLHDSALRILNPFVMQQKDATQAEMAEYGVSLIKIGALDEGLSILSKVNEINQPESLLFRAFALFSRWEYSQAIPLLLAYINLCQKIPYGYLLGHVNLAAALIFERRFSAAEATLREAKRLALEQKAILLLGNCFEMEAQIHVYKENLSEAEFALNNARASLKQVNSFDEFFVRKWTAILELVRNKADSESLQRMSEVQKTAREIGHWETIRDCDLHKARISRNGSLFQHLFAGTPHPSYRGMIVRDYGNLFEIPQTYNWHLGPKHEKLQLIDFSDLKMPRIPAQLLHILSTDFYRPFRPATLFFRLFPNESYDPQTSLDRVHQGISRLRQNLKQFNLPLSIVGKDGNFNLFSSLPVTIHVHLQSDLNREQLLLKNKFGKSEFSAKEASLLLGVSQRTAVRILSEARQKGAITAIGAARAILYRFL